MVNYNLAKIYKIICNTSGLIYVGSTCEPTLARRLAAHNGNYKCYLNGNTTYYTTSYRVLENNNYEIILIEDCPCETKDQLHARERYWIENLVCVNKKIPGRTKKEWGEDNKEQIKIKQHEYNEKNKEQIKIQQHEYREENKEQIKIKNHEWYKENKEHLKTQQQEYNEKNKESIKERKSQKIKCVCGVFYTHAHKSRHEKSQRHIKFIEEQKTLPLGEA